MKQYQALLIDLDNTLYPYAPSHQAGMEAVYSKLFLETNVDRKMAQDAFEQSRAQIHTRLSGSAASHHRLLYMQGLCELLGINPFKYAPLLYHIYWEKFISSMALYPGVRDFFTDWRRLGKRICIVTDLTAEIQFKKITALGFNNDIDFLVTSEEVGHEKPHPLMFLTALDKLQLSKKEVVMVGDHFQKDVLAARRIGIDAYWFAPESTNTDEEKSIHFSQLIETIV